VHCTHHPTGDSKRRASTAPESAALPTTSLQTRIFSNLLVKRSDPSYHRDRTLKCCHENIFLFVERTHCSQEVENSIARGEDVGSSRVIFRGRRGYAWGSIGEAAETLRASLAHGSCPLPALWCTKVQLCLHKFGLASFELRLRSVVMGRHVGARTSVSNTCAARTGCMFSRSPVRLLDCAASQPLLDFLSCGCGCGGGCSCLCFLFGVYRND